MRKLMKRRAAGAVSVALLVALATLPLVALGNNHENLNDPEYWAGQYPNAVACYKHSGNSVHGSITDNGKAVTLNEFQDFWPGDRWEVLIIKAGSATYTDPDFGEIVDGNRVIVLPSAGQTYFAPQNDGGNTAAVSHWIVCKGETPLPDTTEPTETTTTEPETTEPETTEPETTEPETTEPETTEPETTEPETTEPETTEPETTEPETTEPETTEPETTESPDTTVDVRGETTSSTEGEPEAEEETTSTTEDDETEDTLPFTGIGTDGIALAAVIALASGAGLVFLTGRSEESEIEG